MKNNFNLYKNNKGIVATFNLKTNLKFVNRAISYTRNKARGSVDPYGIKKVNSEKEKLKIFNEENEKIEKIKQIYSSNEIGSVWKYKKGKYIGISHKKMKYEKGFDFIITNKVNEDDIVERNIIDNRKTRSKGSPVYGEFHNIKFINPYTKKKDNMDILIEQGHTRGELFILKKALKMTLETKVNYLKMARPVASHGKIIYSGIARRNRDLNRNGYCIPSEGLIHIDLRRVFYHQDYKENKNRILYNKHSLFKIFSTLSHENGHIVSVFSDKLFRKKPITESWARTMAFLAEKECMENHPEYEFTESSFPIFEVYEANKNLNISSLNMMKILILSDLHTNIKARGYGSDIGDIKDVYNDIELLRADTLKGIEIDDIRKLNFTEESIKDYKRKCDKVIINSIRWSHLKEKDKNYNFPDVYVAITNREAGKNESIEINMCKILNPDESGVKKLSGIGINRPSRFNRILGMDRQKD